MRIRKYSNTKCTKYQILSGISCFKINGGTPERNERVYNECVEEANKIIEKNGYKYFLKDMYTEPNYGIIGLNLRVYSSQEDLDKELKLRQRAQIRAQKAHEKYLIQRAKWDEEEAEMNKGNGELLEEMISNKVFDPNLIKVSLPRYNAQFKTFMDLVVRVSDKYVERILEGKEFNYREVEQHGWFDHKFYNYLLGEDFLDYKVVNKIINYINEHTNKYKINLIDEKHKVRYPMAYCVLDEKKYPGKNGCVIDKNVFDKLSKYNSIAFDIKVEKGID